MKTFCNAFLVLGIFSLIGSCSPAGEKTNETRVIEKFNQGWKFSLDGEIDAIFENYNDSGWQPVDIPHDWSIGMPNLKTNSSSTPGGWFSGGVGWYRKSFTVPDSYENKKVYILFEGIYMLSEVFINGAKVGERDNGYVSHFYDVSSYLKPGQKNLIAVRVNNSYQPFDRWYSGCGIYRNVWLVATDKLHIPIWGTFVTTPKVSADRAEVNIQTSVTNNYPDGKEITLESEVFSPKGKSIANTSSAIAVEGGSMIDINQNISLKNPELWSTSSPLLYTLVSRVKIGKEIVDQHETKFGVRTIAFSPDSGFALNGKKLILKGVCIHHDLGALGAAAYDKEIERRLLLLKEIGCNAIRLSHNPHAPNLIKMCDSLGILVINEMFDRWEKRLDRNQSDALPFIETWEQDFSDFMKRDRNSPSVILWSVGNETVEQQFSEERGIELIQMLRALVLQMDSTRPVTAGMHPGHVLFHPQRGNIEPYMDVASYNYATHMFEQWSKDEPDLILLSSETKCYDDKGVPALGREINFANNSWFDLGPNACGQFIWTGIDYFGESPIWPYRGWPWSLINSCGFRRPISWFTQSVYSSEPMVYITAYEESQAKEVENLESWSKLWAPPSYTSHWSYPLNEGEIQSVAVFSNCESVELFLNDKSLGVKYLSDFKDRVYRWEVPYQKGTIKAQGKNGEIVLATHELKTAAKPVKIKLLSSVSSLKANNEDLLHVEVNLVDEQGILNPYARNEIKVEVTGNGTLVGIDNGDMTDHFNLKGNEVKANQGRCLFIVKSTGKPGKIDINVSSKGLLNADLLVESY